MIAYARSRGRKSTEAAQPGLALRRVYEVAMVCGNHHGTWHGRCWTAEVPHDLPYLPGKGQGESPLQNQAKNSFCAGTTYQSIAQADLLSRQAKVAALPGYQQWS